MSKPEIDSQLSLEVSGKTPGINVVDAIQTAEAKRREPQEAPDLMSDEEPWLDTYRELHVHTPAQELLWEGQNILREAEYKYNSAEIQYAIMLDLIEGYALVSWDEALSLVDRRKLPREVEVEALAKLGGGPFNLDKFVKEARRKAESIDDLLVVGKYGHDAESLRRATAEVDRFRDINRYTQIASLGYRPALLRAKQLMLDYLASGPAGQKLSPKEEARMNWVIDRQSRTTPTDVVSAIEGIDAAIETGEIAELSGPDDDDYTYDELEELNKRWKMLVAARLHGDAPHKAEPIEPISTYKDRLILDYIQAQHNRDQSKDSLQRGPRWIVYRNSTKKYEAEISAKGVGVIKSLSSEIGNPFAESKVLALSEAIKRRALELEQRLSTPKVEIEPS